MSETVGDIFLTVFEELKQTIDQLLNPDIPKRFQEVLQSHAASLYDLLARLTTRV